MEINHQFDRNSSCPARLLNKDCETPVKAVAWFILVWRESRLKKYLKKVGNKAEISFFHPTVIIESPSFRSAVFGTYDQDAISNIFVWFYQRVNSLPLSSFGFLMHLTLLFLLPTILCFLSFRLGSRSTALQVVILVFGILIAGIIPVQIYIGNPILKFWIGTACLLALLFLPQILPRFVVAEFGKQKRMAICGYALIGLLFFLTLFHA